MATIRVQTQDFDIGAEFAALTAGRVDIGGIGSFVGTVRSDSPEFTALTLEHYPAMTARALQRIAATAEARWHLMGCTLIHRHGRLLPGANIVLVLAGAAHRAPALEATAFLIDWLKTSAPFWKKESFAGSDDRWVEARAADDVAAARWSALSAGPASS